MFSAGIDVGAENIKVAVLEDNRLLAAVTFPGSWDTRLSLDSAYTGVVVIVRKFYQKALSGR
jgi:hypothetical protein